MQYPVGFSPLIGLVAALALCACDKRPLDTPEPRLDTGATDAAAIANNASASAPTPSVPPADEVFTASATATKADPTAGRSNSAMSRAQESTAMPMPGQNNDHSAALNLPKVPASGTPRR
ncbi:hypothetical protein [Roseateles sp.]|uniref:hypothetical protein n=1 Tax=Roseateles sp. TaxID=1971397 RepID=UPI00286CA479|nr:hypothetical protein [Roseateles sp.]